MPGPGVPDPGGMVRVGTWSRGPCLGGSSFGGCLVETPGRPLLRAVHILLECILVAVKFTKLHGIDCSPSYN